MMIKMMTIESRLVMAHYVDIERIKHLKNEANPALYSER